MSTITIHTDGGARGNPGPAAIGVFLEMNDWNYEYAGCIGDATNNVAEYKAVLKAAEIISDATITHPEITAIQFFLDSELVVRQLIGQYKVKDSTLQLLHQRILTLLRAAGHPFTFTHVPRAQNKKADALVNYALDNA